MPGEGAATHPPPSPPFVIFALLLSGGGGAPDQAPDAREMARYPSQVLSLRANVAFCAACEAAIEGRALPTLKVCGVCGVCGMRAVCGMCAVRRNL